MNSEMFFFFFQAGNEENPFTQLFSTLHLSHCKKEEEWVWKLEERIFIQIKLKRL